MGCDAADVIAAIAPVATDLRTQPCNSARPISMLEVRGMADLCSLPNVEHSPDNNALGFNVAGVAWDMFERHARN